jgi:hypothetical protein
MWRELKDAIAAASAAIRLKIRIITLKGRDIVEYHSTRMRIWQRDRKFHKYVRNIRSDRSMPTMREFWTMLNAYDWEMKCLDVEEGACPSLKWHKKYDPLYAHIIRIASISIPHCQLFVEFEESALCRGVRLSVLA